MPAPISVIIPTLNSAALLAPTLAGLIEGVEAGLIREVLFADGGSKDGTADIAMSTGARFIPAPVGRGSQMATAAQTAGGDWLLFLHSDTTLSAGWSQAVAVHLSSTDRAGWFSLAFDQTSYAAKLVADWANLRSRLFRLPYGDQGLLIHKTLYQKAGGYPPIPLMEDVALARELRQNLAPINATATTSAEKFITQGWLRRGTCNLITLLQFFWGRDPADLAKKYYQRR